MTFIFIHVLFGRGIPGYPPALPLLEVVVQVAGKDPFNAPAACDSRFSEATLHKTMGRFIGSH